MCPSPDFPGPSSHAEDFPADHSQSHHRTPSGDPKGRTQKDLTTTTPRSFSRAPTQGQPAPGRSRGFPPPQEKRGGEESPSELHIECPHFTLPPNLPLRPWPGTISHLLGQDLGAGSRSP